ncbi:MAG: aspartate carbamoyltransferase catalytic subunit [Actinomycetia bacterium]|nr:aspartate carbamoyltransferase catalytic subunit [Actinomycetes bacterium]
MKHLLSIADLDRTAIEEILDLADVFAEVGERNIPKVPALRGKSIAWLFWEDSTRTRLSFETAAKRLSADTMNFSVGSSSVNKGESLRDTVETIEAMGVDCIVVRHGSSGAPWQLTAWTDASVINAGDGWHEHPTQALLDSYTIRQNRDALDGQRIAIVGDIKHSRVARSDIVAYLSLGAEVILVGPHTLLPPSLEGWGVKVTTDLDEVIGEIDVLYLLRMQRERIGDMVVPSLREYTAHWGLTPERLRRLRADALIMHPGPMNRGVEICAEATEDSRAVIVDQVRNGVAIRCAVLYLLLGSGLDLVGGES